MLTASAEEWDSATFTLSIENPAAYKGDYMLEAVDFDGYGMVVLNISRSGIFVERASLKNNDTEWYYMDNGRIRLKSENITDQRLTDKRPTFGSIYSPQAKVTFATQKTLKNPTSLALSISTDKKEYLLYQEIIATIDVRNVGETKAKYISLSVNSGLVIQGSPQSFSLDKGEHKSFEVMFMFPYPKASYNIAVNASWSDEHGAKYFIEDSQTVRLKLPLEIRKSATGEVKLGKQAYVSLSVENVQTIPLRVSLSDALPISFTPVNGTITDNNLRWEFDLAPGKTKVFTYQMIPSQAGAHRLPRAQATYLWGGEEYTNTSKTENIILVYKGLSYKEQEFGKPNVTVVPPPIVIMFVSPTPVNGSETNASYVDVSVTLSENGTARLNWNGINESMVGTGTSFYKNKTSLLSGDYTFKVYANNTFGNTNVTQTRIVTVNRTTVNTTIGTIINTSTFIINATLEIAAPSGNVTVTIPNGTNASVGGASLTSISIDSMAQVNCTYVQNLSRTYKFAGENLTLGPEGARFSPDVQIRFNYTDAQLTAAGIDESTLAVQFYNITSNQWEALTTYSRDTTLNYTIVNVSHFSTFALLGTTAAGGDLLPIAIKPYHYEWWDQYKVPKGDPWFNLTNYVNVTVNNTGTADASSFKVRLYADDELIGEKIISLTAGGSTEEKFEWKPTGKNSLSWVDMPYGSKITYTTTDRTYILKAAVDEANEVPETNEANNNMTRSQKVVWNGYTGNEPLQNYIRGKVKGGMIYTTGDGAYQGVGAPGTTYGTYYNVTYNLEIPGTPEISRLYIYYNWAQSPTSPHEAPKMGVTLTTPSGTHTLSMDKGYNDYKGEFGPYRYPWGTYACNITEYVTTGGTYKVSITNLNDGSDTDFATGYAFAAPAILTVYENNSMPLREYWINEGADILLGGRRGDGGFLAWWECMNNATFHGSITKNNATLGIVSPWADNAPDDEVYFNDHSLGRGIYCGYNDPCTMEKDGLKMILGSGTQVSINASDVTSYLAASSNRLAHADDGDNMMSANAFLLLEVAEVIPEK